VVLRDNPAAREDKSSHHSKSIPAGAKVEQISTESLKDLEEKVKADQKEMDEKKKSGKRLAPFIQERMEKRAAKLADLQKAR